MVVGSCSLMELIDLNCNLKVNHNHNSVMLQYYQNNLGRSSVGMRLECTARALMQTLRGYMETV